ncbi:hypothetical protein KAI87_08080, partial [Myxococcota bacterium]|nr:hypothetical protein [Myxococcota bacterium]
MSAIWVAWRLILELMRDKRTFGFFIFAPVMVMSLVYIAVAEEEVANVGILTRGVARLYDYDLEEALSKEDDIQIVPLNISDEEIDPQVLEAAIREELLSGRVDGILYMNAELLPLRFDGKAGDLHIYVLGSNPTITGAVFAGMAAAMDDLSSALPVVIDSDCSSFCAESVNNKPINLEKHFIYGSD